MAADKHDQKFILFLCALAYASIYLGRLNLSIAAPLIRSSGIMNEFVIGTMSSIFFLIYAFGRLINGYVGDRVDPKLMLIVGVTVSGLCNVIVGSFVSVSIMIGFWGVNGFFQSMIWSPALKSVANAYENSSKKSHAFMIMSLSVGVGNLFAVIIATLLSGVGTRAIFIIPGMYIIIIGLILFLLPAQTLNRGKENKLIIKDLIPDKDVAFMLIPAAIHGVIKDNLAFWAPMFFINFYGLNIKNAAIYVFLMPIATVGGRLLLPLLYKVFNNNEKRVAISSFILCAIVLVPFINLTRLPMTVSAVLLLVTAIATSIINGTFLSLYPTKYQKCNKVSSVSGIIDTATYVGSAAGSLIYGIIFESAGKKGYMLMFVSWIILCLLSVIILMGKEIKKAVIRQIKE